MAKLSGDPANTSRRRTKMGAATPDATAFKAEKDANPTAADTRRSEAF